MGLSRLRSDNPSHSSDQIASNKAHAGRETIQSRFSLETAVQQNLAFYRSVLAGEMAAAPVPATPVMELQS